MMRHDMPLISPPDTPLSRAYAMLSIVAGHYAY